jgi:hypothetical protein
MGVSDQRHALAALTPGKTRYPLYRRLGGYQGQSGSVREISLPPGFDPRTVHPIVRRYTDCAIPAHTQPSYCFDKQEISTFSSSANAHLHLLGTFRCLEHKSVFLQLRIDANLSLDHARRIAGPLLSLTLDRSEWFPHSGRLTRYPLNRRMSLDVLDERKTSCPYRDLNA